MKKRSLSTRKVVTVTAIAVLIFIIGAAAATVYMYDTTPNNRFDGIIKMDNVERVIILIGGEEHELKNNSLDFINAIAYAEDLKVYVTPRILLERIFPALDLTRDDKLPELRYYLSDGSLHTIALEKPPETQLPNDSPGYMARLDGVKYDVGGRLFYKEFADIIEKAAGKNK